MKKIRSHRLLFIYNQQRSGISATSCLSLPQRRSPFLSFKETFLTLYTSRPQSHFTHPLRLRDQTYRRSHRSRRFRGTSRLFTLHFSSTSSRRRVNSPQLELLHHCYLRNLDQCYLDHILVYPRRVCALLQTFEGNISTATVPNLGKTCGMARCSRKER